MNDNLNERSVERKRVPWSKAKQPILMNQVIVPCLVVLIIMLVMVAVLQHHQIGLYQEAVDLLEESTGYQETVIVSLRAENESLRENVSFSEQTLEEIDMDYIQAIPEGVDLRIQLVLQALGGES